MMENTPQILVVDDDVRMCESLRFLLRRNGYEISTANSGRQAQALLVQKTFDIAILDVVLPDANGHQLMEHVLSCAPDTKVIMITGYCCITTASEALSKGAYSYVKKPFEYDEFLQIIQSALSQEALKQEKGRCYKRSAQVEIIVSQKTIDRTNLCEKNFSCLKGEKGDMCEIIYTVGESTLITLCGSKPFCPYCKIFVDIQGICFCPTRIEIYKKYGI